VEVQYHPLFERWLSEFAEADEEIFGEVMALLTALEVHGRNLEDDGREESHPVVTSRLDMHALRRTPPSQTTPYASAPPVLRILYAHCTDPAGDDVAVILIAGDKSRLGNLWYPPKIAEAEQRLEQYHRVHRQLRPITKRAK